MNIVFQNCVPRLLKMNTFVDLLFSFVVIDI